MLKASLKVTIRAIRARLPMWLAITLGFPIALYLLQLSMLCLRFRALPNYFRMYDWTGNVARIIRSTSSLADIVSISAQEWWLEIGRETHEYGFRVSEWSLAIMPAKLALMMLVGALFATHRVLLAALSGRCERRAVQTGTALSVSGAVLSSMTAVTITWVACCGVPSWVTGLSILGLSYSVALVLKPFGSALMAVGFGCLLMGTLILIRRAALDTRR